MPPCDVGGVASDGMVLDITCLWNRFRTRADRGSAYPSLTSSWSSNGTSWGSADVRSDGNGIARIFIS
jgi:hypothetical protein